MKKTKKAPIIALAPNNWDGPWMCRQQLLSRMAQRGWPVLYSTGPLSYWDRGSDIWTTSNLLTRVVNRGNVNVVQPGKLFAKWPKFSAHEAFFNTWHAHALLRRIPRFRSEGILLCYHPFFTPFVRLLQPRYLVYHAYDRFCGPEESTSLLSTLEKQLVEQCDIVLASSTGIAVNLPATGAAKLVELNNGADVVAFGGSNIRPCPPDLAAIPSPRIGYVGRISRKVDLRTAKEVAIRHRDWNWVFVGPEVTVQSDKSNGSEEFNKTLDACKKLPNMHFIGYKHYSKLPEYVLNMDVNTMIYKINGGWWEDIYPLKLHEYLATGKPVVGSNLKALEAFREVVGLVETPDEWEVAIENALNGKGVGKPETRIRVASQNSWDIRVDLLEKLLYEVMK